MLSQYGLLCVQDLFIRLAEVPKFGFCPCIPLHSIRSDTKDHAQKYTAAKHLLLINKENTVVIPLCADTWGRCLSLSYWSCKLHKHQDANLSPNLIYFCFVFYQQLTFIFSWFYIRFYQDHAQSEVSSTLTGIVALAITLLTTALVPVDIFLVSYMKNADGTWKVCYT